MKLPVLSSSGRGATALRAGVGVAVLLAALLLYPMTEPSSRSLSFATSVLVFGIAATGLGIMWGQAGQVSVAHAAVMGVGAYVAAVLGDVHDLTFVQTLPLALIGGAVAGGIVSLFAFRTTGHYFIILTFAVGEVAVVLATRLDSITGGLNGTTLLAGDQKAFGIALSDREAYYRLVAIAVAIVAVAAIAVMRSRWGVLLRGMRENSNLAKSLGMNIGLHRSLIFMVGGACAGLAGQLFVYQVKFIAPSMFDLDVSIFFLLMVLLGGRRYLLGPLLGAAVYILLPEFIFLSPIRSRMVLGLALIAMILILPEGILSLGTRLRRWVASRGKAERTDAGFQLSSAPEEQPAVDTEKPALSADRVETKAKS